MSTIENDQPIITTSSDTNRNTSWWPLIAIPLFFILGWATNDAMANSDSVLCPNVSPVTNIVERLTF
ncbi:MAG: hypothetical protein WCT01_05070 [Candidatus Shapirobacteria bacterium]